MAKPQAMNITTRPFTRNEKLLKTNADSGSTAANAGVATIDVAPSRTAYMSDFRVIVLTSL